MTEGGQGGDRKAPLKRYMENNEKNIREQICEVGYELWQLGFVAANDGNISVKLDDGSIITTPTGVSKKKMTPDILVKMDISGKILSDNGLKASSEVGMHLRCYQVRDDIRAVVHAHPPYATAYACANIPLDDYCLSEAVTFLGAVPCAKYATPGTPAVADSIEPFLPEHDAVLLMNHGALTVGKDLTSAYFRMETLEHYAKVCFIASQIGTPKEIPIKSIEELSDVGRAMGIRHPGYKKYS